MAYLAEENTPGFSAYTVAPGCVGTDRGPATTRCSLKEFLLYIWKKMDPDVPEPKPTGWNKPPSQGNGWFDLDTEKNNIDSVISTITAAETNYGKPITGNANSELLMPGRGDFYSVLGHMSEPIQRMAAAIAALPEGQSATVKQQRILAKGTEAAEAVVGLRWQDLEKFRLKAIKSMLQKTFSKDAEVGTIDWRTGYGGQPTQMDENGHPIPNSKGAAIKLFDVLETVALNGPGSFQAVVQAGRQYVIQSERAINHMTAIAAAQRAATGLGCNIPTHILTRRDIALV